MNPLPFIIAAIGGGFALILTRKSNATPFETPERFGEYLQQNYSAYYAPVSDISNFDVSFTPHESTFSPAPNIDISLIGSAQNIQPNTDYAERNMQAFLALIRHVESGNRYDVINGHSDRTPNTFTDFSDHPFVINRNRKNPGASTASGAYQFVRGTWLEMKSKLGLLDFSPASQDLAARQYVIDRGAKPFIDRGDYLGAMSKLREEWEAFDLMLAGGYSFTVADATNFLRERDFVTV